MSNRQLVWVIMLVAVGAIFFGVAPMVAWWDGVYRTYGPLVEVDALVRRQYVESIGERPLVDGALRGMMRELDPYSAYIAPDEMARFKRRSGGGYVGIGVEFGLVAGAVTVVSPIERGPAMRAGVRSGDVLLNVNGRATDELSLFDVGELLVGAPGSDVSLTLRRAGGAELDVTVTRAAIHRELVRGFSRRADGVWDYFVDEDRGVAYVRVAHFGEGLAGAFDGALAAIVEGGAWGLIIDLRDNPGGIMAEAVAIVDRFVDSGVILTTVTRREAVDTYYATSEGAKLDIALAVLINGGSASSSEIVAGALQDHGRAVIVGERSFGKGSVQSLFNLDGGGGVKLTVARYRLPGGRTVHRAPGAGVGDEWGVIPDVVVTLDKSDPNGADAQFDAAVEALASTR